MIPIIAQDHVIEFRVAENWLRIAFSVGTALHTVPPDKSILDVLLDQGHSLDSSCQEGLCGTCIVEVLEGPPDHRDFVLDDDEKASNALITICCSRAKGARLKLDL